MNSSVTFINPPFLIQNPAFSHVAVTHSPGRTIYIGGQNAITKEFEFIGENNIAQQTAYILENIEKALEVAGAKVDDIVKLNIYIVQGQDVQKGFEGAQAFLKKLKNPPLITGIIVAGLANPKYLVEIEAVAYIAENKSASQALDMEQAAEPA